MRGKLHAVAVRHDGRGITPAHAGKTRLTLICPAVDQDHPRACGENLAGFIAEMALLGSPPRMRGKLKERLIEEENRGITPAHAGKTTTRFNRRVGF